MSDIKLVYPERKFRVGTKTKGRLLNYNGKRALVTFRKALVNLEDDEILSDIDQAEIDLKLMPLWKNLFLMVVLYHFSVI